MHLSSKLGPFLVTFGLLGCAAEEEEQPAPPPGQIGGEPYACEPKAVQTLAIDETSPLGFSAADILGFAQGTHDAGFVWDAGGSTPMTLTVPAPSEVRFADLGLPPVGDPQLYGEIGCANHVELDVIVTLATGDGAFAETFDVILIAASTSRAAFSESVAPEAISGSYVFDERDPSTYDKVDFLTFNAMLDPTGANGDVNALLSHAASPGNDGVVSAENVTIGTFAP